MVKCQCNECEERSFSEKYDAAYCKKRNMWLEPKCDSQSCEYCGVRPPYPDMKKRRKLVEQIHKEAAEWKKMR